MIISLESRFYIVKITDSGKPFFRKQHGQDGQYGMTFEDAVDMLVEYEEKEPALLSVDLTTDSIVDETYYALAHLAAKSRESCKQPGDVLCRLMTKHRLDFYHEPDPDLLREDQQERRRVERHFAHERITSESGGLYD